MMQRFHAVCGGFAAAFVLTLCTSLPMGCSSARVMTSEEGNVIGKQHMGIEGYERLTEEAMTKLLDRVRTRMGDERGQIMAYMGMINETNEPSRATELLRAVSQKVQTMLAQSGTFEIMSDRAIEAARRAAGISRPDNLLLEADRKNFLAALGSESVQPDYFFYGTVNSATTEADSGRQKNYYMNFQIIDARKGTIYEVVNTADNSFRKFYN